ncbi:MAG TPA: lactonase family protein [Planctomycetota bacterium]|nr:lactonase family protein [Planctomycetota bacterium]
MIYWQKLMVLCLVAVLAVGGAWGGEGAMPQNLVFVGGYNNIVTVFELNTADGTLRKLSSSDVGKNPTFMAWSPNKKYLYTVNEIGPGRISAFSINPTDGSLTKINDASSAGDGPCHVSVHPSGKWVFSANYGSGHYGALPVDDKGGVGEPVSKLQGGKNAHMIITDASGKFVFTPFCGSHYIAINSFDDKSGELKLITNAPSAEGGGPRHMAIHPNGKTAYVINEYGDSMTSYDYDSATGAMTNPETLPTIPADFDGKKNSCAHVVVSPDGKFVYGSNRGHDSIAIFSTNEKGRLKFVGWETGDGEIKTPRNFSLDPSGNYMLVASQKTGVVIVFRRDKEKGTLTKLNVTPVTPGPSFVATMPLN